MQHDKYENLVRLLKIHLPKAGNSTALTNEIMDAIIKENKKKDSSKRFWLKPLSVAASIAALVIFYVQSISTTELELPPHNVYKKRYEVNIPLCKEIVSKSNFWASLACLQKHENNSINLLIKQYAKKTYNENHK